MSNHSHNRFQTHRDSTISEINTSSISKSIASTGYRCVWYPSGATTANSRQVNNDRGRPVTSGYEVRHQRQPSTPPPPRHNNEPRNAQRSGRDDRRQGSKRPPQQRETEPINRLPTGRPSQRQGNGSSAPQRPEEPTVAFENAVSSLLQHFLVLARIETSSKLKTETKHEQFLMKPILKLIPRAIRDNAEALDQLAEFRTNVSGAIRSQGVEWRSLAFWLNYQEAATQLQRGVSISNRNDRLARAFNNAVHHNSVMLPIRKSKAIRFDRDRNHVINAVHIGFRAMQHGDLKRNIASGWASLLKALESDNCTDQPLPNPTPLSGPALQVSTASVADTVANISMRVATIVSPRQLSPVQEATSRPSSTPLFTQSTESAAQVGSSPSSPAQASSTEVYMASPQTASRTATPPAPSRTATPPPPTFSEFPYVPGLDDVQAAPNRQLSNATPPPSIVPPVAPPPPMVSFSQVAAALRVANSAPTTVRQPLITTAMSQQRQPTIPRTQQPVKFTNPERPTQGAKRKCPDETPPRRTVINKQAHGQWIRSWWRKYLANNPDVPIVNLGPGKWQCSECFFIPNNVACLVNHIVGNHPRFSSATATASQLFRTAGGAQPPHR